jgi:hypothetical protein
MQTWKLSGLMKPCRFKVDKGITLLGLKHAPISYDSLGDYSGPPEEENCARFELYMQQEEDFEGDPIGQPVKCAEQLVLQADDSDEDEELQNLMLSNPLLIQPNVWYILFLHNAGDSDVCFVSNVLHTLEI